MDIELEYMADAREELSVSVGICVLTINKFVDPSDILVAGLIVTVDPMTTLVEASLDVVSSTEPVVKVSVETDALPNVVDSGDLVVMAVLKIVVSIEVAVSLGLVTVNWLIVVLSF